MTRGFLTTTTNLVLLHYCCSCLVACRAAASATATIPATFVAQNVECMLYAVKSIDAQVQEQQEQQQQQQQEGPVESWMCGDMDTMNSNDNDNNDDNDDENRFRSISFADIEIEIDSDSQTDLQEYVSSSGAESGRSKLIVSQVIVTPSTATMVVPKGATLQIEHVAASHERLRRLAPSQGQLKTLVVRVLDANNQTPEISPDDLYDTVLLNASGGDSMANQYRDCSHGKLDIVPYGGTKNTALVDIQIDLAIEVGVTSRTTVANAAKTKIRDLYGDEYDLVQFCMPGGTLSAKGTTGQNWAAFAPMNDKHSYANDKGDYCGSISTWVHEIGHNIGLYHSGGTDQTDPMGASYNETKYGYQKQCFNAAKNYQLGWYGNMQKTVDPLQFSGPSFSKTFKMIGVTDYNDEGGGKKKVILKLKDHYIGYNAQKGITNGDRFDADTIFIVREDGEDSQKAAALTKGQSYTIENYESGRDVTIQFLSVTNNDVVTIEIIDDRNAPVETLPPVGSGCYAIQVEVVGDNYPTDINWIIEDVGTNLVVVGEDTYTNKKNFTNPDIRAYCLPFDTDYRFIMKDDNGDGICCRNYGDGYYRVLGENGETLSWGGKLEGETRPYDYELSDAFSTPPAPPLSDFLSDNPFPVDPSCINSAKKFKIGGTKFTCDTIRRKKHCDLDNDNANGKSVRKLCPSVCQKKKCGGGGRRLVVPLEDNTTNNSNHNNNNASEDASKSSLRRGQPQR